MSNANAPVYWHYRLHLESPAIVTTVSGDPNSAATQLFIPGGTIRGAVAARLLGGGGGNCGKRGDWEGFDTLILSGQVRYLHAYPEADDARTLPRLLSWRSDKNDLDQRRGFDLAYYCGEASPEEVEQENLWPSAPLASPPGEFASLAGTEARLVSPEVGSRIHHQRDRWFGRAREEHGAVFAYEYLEPDQVFRGVIQLMPGAQAYADCLQKLLKEPLLVGRSRRAGYGGQARVEFLAERPHEYENLTGLLRSGVKVGEGFRAVLVSAYVGRHPQTGQLDPEALLLELKEAFSQAGCKISVKRVCWDFQTVGAFNRKWRLEVPQAPAVAAGSVMVLQADSEIPHQVLQEIQHQGLGLRRVEGFGRVVFLEHEAQSRSLSFKKEKKEKQQDASPPPLQMEVLTREEQDQLQFLERRILLAAAEEAIVQCAAKLAQQTTRLPTNSLLGRLRTLFRRVTDEQTAREALVQLGKWCQEDGEEALRENARGKLQQCQVGRLSFWQWLRALATCGHDEAGWQKLCEAAGSSAALVNLADQKYLTSQEAAQQILNDHSALLRVYLIDLFLAALAHKNKERVA